MGYTEVKISGWVEDDFRVCKGSEAYGLLFYLALSDPNVVKDCMELCCFAYGEEAKNVLQAAWDKKAIVMEAFCRIEEILDPETSCTNRMTILEALSVQIVDERDNYADQAVAAGRVHNLTRHLSAANGIYYTFEISPDEDTYMGEDCVECRAWSKDEEAFFQRVLEDPEAEFEVTGFISQAGNPSPKGKVILVAEEFKEFIREKK